MSLYLLRILRLCPLRPIRKYNVVPQIGTSRITNIHVMRMEDVLELPKIDNTSASAKTRIHV